MILHERKTPFGDIRVEDSADGIIRTLFVNGVSQGRYNTATGSPQSFYLQEMADKIVLLKLKTALVLGGGAGLISNVLGYEGYAVDTVEQSQDIAEVAEKYFYFNGTMLVGDAFKLLPTLGKYDLIVYDLFNGLEPAHGPSNFLRDVLDHVNDYGHLLINRVDDGRNYVVDITKGPKING